MPQQQNNHLISLINALETVWQAAGKALRAEQEATDENRSMLAEVERNVKLAQDARKEVEDGASQLTAENVATTLKGALDVAGGLLDDGQLQQAQGALEDYRNDSINQDIARLKSIFGNDFNVDAFKSYLQNPSQVAKMHNPRVNRLVQQHNLGDHDAFLMKAADAAGGKVSDQQLLSGLGSLRRIAAKLSGAHQAPSQRIIDAHHRARPDGPSFSR